MKNKMIRKTLIFSGYTLLLLTVVLAIHIYWVTRPKAPDASTKIMARIDIKQHIDQNDANKIATWLYQQKGIDHVLVNPQTAIVVFTFFPIKTTANTIVSNFKSTFPYTAERFVPTKDQMSGGCPVASTSFTYKLYSFFKKIF
jgi:hypothetical protein